ncbi:uncharacterized protein CLAFUR5_04222 [Fulvia fulva]|uniref:Uncharacterized protein n=1 Tax=Passalora fulva TaxID=5499 RepID=A0A9Q8LH83_PASFU|nr:uncharacterized protein CLAFUR5_04222 [Fulvia fulva]KAK4628270.1 hypothetical protein CLAFUR0_04244 [Fulvia fulva]UJO16583.1 hypothetical protein CLAFUR5_04222 [Fulvia fulva]WPV28928.1 hypothetical protein CLAFUW7_04245 [Fulvia fulva]
MDRPVQSVHAAQFEQRLKDPVIEEVHDDPPTNAIPGSFPDTNDTNEGTLPMTNDNNEKDTNDTTTPQLQQHQLVHSSSGLPPTPPTMTNSDIAESQPERVASPAPLFADRVRNALQSHKSGLSTPVNDLGNHSPPTPEASPRRKEKENLAVPRPPLTHYPSSYADSFKTATEGLSANGSSSRVHSPEQDFTSEQHKTWWERTKPFPQAAIGLGLDLQREDISKPQSDESGKSIGSHRPMERNLASPQRNYEPERLRKLRDAPEPFPDFDQNLTEDSEAGEARKKNYPVSSPETNGDSEWLSSINPRVIEAALQPEPSPKINPAPLEAALQSHPSPERWPRSSPVKKSWLSSKTAVWDNADTFSGYAKSDDSPDDYDPSLAPYLAAYDSQLATAWRTEDSDRSEVRVKNYQMESDSDRDRTRPSSSDGPPSPSWRKPLHHRAAVHKLRKPIQPGDDLKRPDEVLLYGSSVPWKRAKVEEAKPRTEPRQPTPPRREMDSEFLRTGNVLPTRRPVLREDVLSEQSQEGIVEDPQTPDNEHESDMAEPPSKLRHFRPDVLSPPASAGMSVPTRKLREFTPSVPPAEIDSPPNTAAKESLVNNNRVYKVIQENNAKRHSVVSEGSAVQATLIFPAEGQRRQLRHSSKRESLRAGISIASLSKANSEESMHTPRLRHKRAMDSIGSSDAPGAPTPERFERRIQTEPINSSCARLTPVAVDDITHGTMRPQRISAMPGAVNGGIIRPPKLRRTLRDQTLHRHSVSFDVDHEAEIPESTPSPRLRRFSEEERLENNREVRRTSLGRESQLISHDMDLKLERLASDLTSVGREMPDRSSIKDRRTSSESKNPTSPRRKSFDPRLLNPIGTPLSTSLSERTAITEAEYGLARGIEIHQHNNDSLLLIHGRSLDYDQANPLSEEPLPSIEHDYDTQAGAQYPTFHAFVESPAQNHADDIIGISKHHVDSPLTNPREAPMPPVIQFIPPTPSEELERTLSGALEQQDLKPGLKRGLSWSQKAKRFSENLVQPLPFGRGGSLRRPRRVVTETEADKKPRPHSLSPMWTPRPMDDLHTDSEDDDDYDDDDDDDDRLPPGGDTSDIPDHNDPKRKSIFPRNMSVRMPGFRGNGGFLVGNSLGLDRHGTNDRRHYVARRPSRESLRRAKQQRRRTFTLPFTGGKRVEYVGLAGLQEHLQTSKQRKEERAAEKRREVLRGQIVTRVYHEGRVAPQ